MSQSNALAALAESNHPIAEKLRRPCACSEATTNTRCKPCRETMHGHAAKCENCKESDAATLATKETK